MSHYASLCPTWQIDHIKAVSMLEYIPGVDNFFSM